MKKAAIAIVMMVAAGPVVAQDGQGGMFSRIDLDGSGTLTVQELEAAGRAMAERSGRAPRMDPARVMERLDTDGNGVLDAQEWAVMAERVRERGGERPNPGEMVDQAFDRMDVDGNGVLSREEFREGAKKMRERREERRGAGE